MENQKRSKNILYISSVIIMLGLAFSIYQIVENNQSSLVGGEEEVSLDALQEHDKVEYQLLDRGFLTTDEAIRDFYDNHKHDRGVHSFEDDTYTYVMITTGNDDGGEVVQLFDIRKDREYAYVGYNFVEDEDNDDIAVMLIRFDQSDESVEGILVDEER